MYLYRYNTVYLASGSVLKFSLRTINFPPSKWPLLKAPIYIVAVTLNRIMLLLHTQFNFNNIGFI